MRAGIATYAIATAASGKNQCEFGSLSLSTLTLIFVEPDGAPSNFDTEDLVKILEFMDLMGGNNNFKD
ncbi:MAG TPA: hypothetical protein VLB84_11515 [Bacteroidia bacterium]|nr:hypothetical protein [Bacteroidia bacterium]